MYRFLELCVGSSQWKRLTIAINNNLLLNLLISGTLKIYNDLVHAPRA